MIFEVLEVQNSLLIQQTQNNFQHFISPSLHTQQLASAEMA